MLHRRQERTQAAVDAATQTHITQTNQKAQHPIKSITPLLFTRNTRAHNTHFPRKRHHNTRSRGTEKTLPRFPPILRAFPPKKHANKRKNQSVITQRHPPVRSVVHFCAVPPRREVLRCTRESTAKPRVRGVSAREKKVSGQIKHALLVFSLLSARLALLPLEKGSSCSALRPEFTRNEHLAVRKQRGKIL